MKLLFLKKMQFICLGLVLLASGTAYAQGNVSGTVFSADENSPMIGVQITVKGTNVGIATDMQGKYSIAASQGDVLVFSYLGYKTYEAAVGTQTVINPSLEPDSQMMDEVVVMGYSTQKKAELSSAVTTLQADALTDVTTPDVGNMLQGKVAGVTVLNTSGQPGAAAQIMIRGTGSLNADSSPLYVVDGIPGGTFNPNDVVSMTILKDAGATAIYGASGGGGVIVVTTKQAARNQPTRFEFKGSYGVKQALMGRFKPMGSAELYILHQKMYPETIIDDIRPESLLDQDFDWINEAFQLGSAQDYYASASGSTENIGYLISVDHYRERGTLINTDFNRTSVHSTLNARLASRLDMNVKFNYSESDEQLESYYTTLEGAYRAMPWDNPYGPDGKPVYIDSGERPADANGYRAPWYGRDQSNFLHSEQYNYNRANSKNLTGDLQLNWRATDWLTATSTNRFERGSWFGREYIDPRTKNPGHAYGYISNSIDMWNSWQTSNVLKAVYEVGNHTLNGLVGWEYGGTHSDEFSTDGQNMPDGMDTLDPSSVISNHGFYEDGATQSFFGQAQYNYLSKYYLTASLRADTDYTRFAETTRTGWFPSISGAWIISNESFLEGNGAITFLKLRASYGETGQSRIDTYRYLSLFSLSGQYQGQPGATPERLANANLRWETAEMAGAGLDFNIGRWLEVNLDVYNINNKDMLLDRPTAPSTGFFDYTENVGVMRNRGFEAMLTSTNFNTKDFKWTTTFNVGINRNTITSLPDDADIILSPQTDGPSQIWSEGDDMYTWYMPKWRGVDTKTGAALWEELVYDGDGNIIERRTTTDYTRAQKQKVGSAHPKFVGGLTNNLSYKNFSLSVVTSFVWGNKIYNSTRQNMDADGAYGDYNQISHANGLGWKRWEKPDDVATHPVVSTRTSSNMPSSRMLEDGSFFRIRNVTLSYNLPAKLMTRMKMEGVRVFASVDNLWTWTKFSGADPEVAIRNTSYSLAGNFGNNYPVGRVFSLGVDIKF